MSSRPKLRAGSVLLISILLVVMTPRVIPATIYDYDGMRDLRFGWPFPFLHQDQSSHTPPNDWFPHRVFALLPQEHPSRVLLGRLALSIVTVAMGLYVIAFAFSQ